MLTILKSWNQSSSKLYNNWLVSFYVQLFHNIYPCFWIRTANINRQVHTLKDNFDKCLDEDCAKEASLLFDLGVLCSAVGLRRSKSAEDRLFVRKEDEPPPIKKIFQLKKKQHSAKQNAEA